MQSVSIISKGNNQKIQKRFLKKHAAQHLIFSRVGVSMFFGFKKCLIFFIRRLHFGLFDFNWFFNQIFNDKEAFIERDFKGQ